MIKISLFQCCCYLILALFAFDSTKLALGKSYDIENENLVDLKTIFYSENVNFNDVNMAPTNINTALSSFKGNTYFVWVDKDQRPVITKVSPDGEDTRSIDNDPNYLVKKDVHHTFSLGIDKDGYIHVTGDMHNYWPKKQNYLSRFDNANSLYWKSSKPEDISSFEFQGSDINKGLPFSGYSYCQFYNDNYMELYLMCRVEIAPGYFTGIRALGLAYYDAENKKWVARGNPPKSKNTNVRAILWEDNGSYSSQFPTPAYQGFQSTLYFDDRNNMHLASTINADNESKGSTHVVYAFSEDGGSSFLRADKSKIGELPMRVEDINDSNGVSRKADVVTQSNGLEGHFWNFAGMYVDSKNNPSISYWPSGVYPNGFKSWVNTWNPQTNAWDNYIEQPTAGSSQPLNVRGPNGVVTYFSTSKYGEVVRSNCNCNYKTHWLNSVLTSIDRQALRNEGMFRLVATNKGEQDSISIIEFKFDNRGAFTKEVWEDKYLGNNSFVNISNEVHNVPTSIEVVAGPLARNTREGDFGIVRLRGILHPEESGDTRFKIEGIKNYEFWLSTDAKLLNSRKLDIDSLSGESEYVFMNEDSIYYFEILYRTSSKNDVMKVKWSQPASIGYETIDGDSVSPWLGSYGKYNE